jgi:hypothetical protein
MPANAMLLNHRLRCIWNTMPRPSAALAPRAVSLMTWLCLALLPSGCGREAVRSKEFFPDEGDLATIGWRAVGEAEQYERDTLYELVDGQADGYLAYGFEQAAVQVYEGESGGQVRATIWRLASPADAYGLFTASIAGAPATIGNEGDADPGRRISFWKDRYYVELFAQPAAPEADLEGLAQAIAAELPAGEGARPELMDRLPAEGLAARSPIFFRQEISIQNRLWLGGENLLGLSAETEGVLARYEVDGREVWLLLVRYPDVEAAAAARRALEERQVEGLVSSAAHEGMLAAAFGPADAAQAKELVALALGER